MKKIYSVFKTLELIMIVHIQREREKDCLYLVFSVGSHSTLSNTLLSTTATTQTN